jgi:hypothetical protein
MIPFPVPGSASSGTVIQMAPPVLDYHPFRSIDFKEWAYIRKQPAGPTAARIPTRGSEFFLDFGFMQASADDYR